MHTHNIHKTQCTHTPLCTHTVLQTMLHSLPLTLTRSLSHTHSWANSQGTMYWVRMTNLSVILTDKYFKEGSHKKTDILFKQVHGIGFWNHFVPTGMTLRDDLFLSHRPTMHEVISDIDTVQRQKAVPGWVVRFGTRIAGLVFYSRLIWLQTNNKHKSTHHSVRGHCTRPLDGST